MYYRALLYLGRRGKIVPALNVIFQENYILYFFKRKNIFLPLSVSKV